MAYGVRPVPPRRLTLDRLAGSGDATVYTVDAQAADQPAERARQLAELGFAPGEAVRVVARAWPGGDPMVVAVAGSRFALRCAEAACIEVEPKR